MRKKDNDNILKQTFVTQTMGYADVSTKQDLWKQVGEEYNGNFRIVYSSGNAIAKIHLAIPYKNYIINISESDAQPLKIESEFNSILDFELVLGWESAFDKFLKRFGLNDIEIGNEKFDNHYVIRSKDSGKTINFLSPEITKCLLKHNVYSVSYLTNNQKRKAKLLLTISRTISDKNTILELIELYRNMIDKLNELHVIL